MHFEAFEPRRLMADTGLDPTFGTNGSITLRDMTLSHAVVSVPGGLFVGAVSTRNGKGFLFKLTSAGRLDTAFGDGGRIATPAFGVDTLAYDKRYNLLYAAGTTTRRSVVRLKVERFDAATGQADTTFGDSSLGVASVPFGEENQGIPLELTIGRLLPLPRRALAVAFDIEDSGYGTVTVVKYTANGTPDRTFGRRGVGVVAGGSDTSDTTDATDDVRSHLIETFDTVAFADLQARADGSLRVITLRRSGHSDEADVGYDYSPVTLNATYYVRSQVFAATGKLDAVQDRSWRVARITPADAVDPEYPDFITILARADGDDGAVFIAIRETADGGAAARAITLTPTGRTSSPLRVPADRYFDTIIPYSRGYYAVYNDYSEVRASKLKSDFALTPSYNDAAETITPVAYSEMSDDAVVADIDGKLLALHDNQITRVRG